MGSRHVVATRSADPASHPSVAPESNTIGKIALGLAYVAAIYAISLGILLLPSVQRFALYAHKFNTQGWHHDVNRPVTFGFAEGQVTPFTIATPDGQKLYAWHVLPLDLYVRHEEALRTDSARHDVVESLGLRLLKDDTSARIVISFHGNAGHVAQGWRTDTYRNIATQANTHVFTVDYRGFGLSTGSPTEGGLITDGISLVEWVMRETNVPADRIVILGQSLGTAVASAVALHFANPRDDLLPWNTASEMRPFLARPESDEAAPPSTAFASIVLVAPFADLPSLLLTYRMGGLIPVLLPLRPFPRLGAALTSRMVDQWKSADRLVAYYRALSAHGKLSIAGRRKLGALQIVHATNDMDISYRQTESICDRIMAASPAATACHFSTRLGDHKAGEGLLLERDDPGRPRVRFEILRRGGHNRVITYTPVAAAIARAFEPDDTV